MQVIIVFPILLIGLYFLYEFGLLAVHNKRAVLFTSSVNGSKARFSSCTGKITRVIRFKEKREYVIRFEKTVEKGEVRLFLYDGRSNALIEFGQKDAYAFAPVPGKRYKLCVRMEKASGSYRIEIR